MRTIRRHLTALTIAAYALAAISAVFVVPLVYHDM